MQIPWNDIVLRDAHVHYFSHGFFTALGGVPGGWEAPPENPAALAARWISELDRHGVARAALIASVHGDEDSVAAAVTRFPERFYGWFMLDPTASDALERAERAFHSGLRGVCLFPAMHRYPLSHPCVAEVCRLAAASPGRIVFVHCGALSVGVRKLLGLSSPFDMRYSNPIDLHPVALAHPGVNFIVPHFGAGYFREALMLSDLCPNVHLDSSSSNAWMRYQPEELDLARVFRRALDVAGPRRILFGTDSSCFPRGWQRAIFEEQARALAQIGISAADARLIFGGNLERLLS